MLLSKDIECRLLGYWRKVCELGRRLEECMMRWDDRDKRRSIEAWIEATHDKEHAGMERAGCDAHNTMGDCLQLFIPAYVCFAVPWVNRL